MTEKKQTKQEQQTTTDSPEQAKTQQEEQTPGTPEQPPQEPAAQAEPLASQLLRLQADFDNFRKRMGRERADWYSRANEELMTELLPALDHYEMGLQKARENTGAQPVVEGFELIYNQLVSALGKFGLKPLTINQDPFDPHLHEAITHFPSTSVPADHVIEQTRRGYMLGEKLLRPAQVVVSSGCPEQDA